MIFFGKKIIISVTIVLVIFASIDLLRKIKMTENDDVDVNKKVGKIIRDVR